MPKSPFHILLGNLIKNAFAYTQKGEVKVLVTQNQIAVIDTGKGGLEVETLSPQEGFGLGLLLVKDICHRYHWEFSLSDNDVGGSTATIYL